MRKHLKNYQSIQYKRAYHRIAIATITAYFAWHLHDYNMKFDYERKL